MVYRIQEDYNGSSDFMSDLIILPGDIICIQFENRIIELLVKSRKFIVDNRKIVLIILQYDGYIKETIV
jgi:hypothetical protein